MRDIKFRGKIKNPKVNKWVYGYLVDECHINEKNQLGYTPIRKETIGQYTGLKDRNMKEIYEGDIVLYQDWEQCYEGGGNDSFINKGIVEYNESNCCFNVTERATIDIEDVLYEGNEDLEVIGNIYDNKNLLEEGE